MPKQVVKGASVAPVYSPATHGPGFVFVSGQIGLNPASGTLDLADGVAEQAEQAFANTAALLAQAGSSLAHVCKVNVYVNDRAHLETVQKVYHKCIGRYAPARSDIVVRKLPLDAKIEVESFAVKTGCRRFQVNVDAVVGAAQAVIGGSKIFVSSTTTAAGGDSDDVTVQTEAALAQLEAALRAADSVLSRVSKIDAYVSADADAGAVTAAIAARVAGSDVATPPAVSCVYSAHMPAGTLVQLACVAHTSPRRHGVHVGAAAGAGDASGRISDAMAQEDGTVFVGVQAPPGAPVAIAEETERVCARLKAVVAASGHALVDVVKVNIYMDSMGDYGEINKVYAKYFTADGMDPPARAAVEVHRLPAGQRVAMEAIVLGTAQTVAAAAAAAATAADGGGQHEERQVEHCVFFAFRKDLSPERLAEIERRTLEFRDLPCVESVAFGPTIVPARSRQYTHALVVRHASRADADTYSNHPLHNIGREEVIMPNIDPDVEVPVLAVDFLVDAAGARVPKGAAVAAAAAL